MIFVNVTEQLKNVIDKKPETELVYHVDYLTKQEAKLAIFKYI